MSLGYITGQGARRVCGRFENGALPPRPDASGGFGVIVRRRKCANTMTYPRLAPGVFVQGGGGKSFGVVSA